MRGDETEPPANSAGNATPSNAEMSSLGDAVQEKRPKRPSQEKKAKEKATGRDRTEEPLGERATPASAGGQAGHGEGSAVVRAEELMGRAGERVGHGLLIGSQKLRRSIALAREAADDLWAEAESIRRGERSNPE